MKLLRLIPLLAVIPIVGYAQQQQQTPVGIEQFRAVAQCVANYEPFITSLNATIDAQRKQIEALQAQLKTPAASEKK